MHVCAYPNMCIYQNLMNLLNFKPFPINMLGLGQNFLIRWLTNPPTVIFQKVEEKKSKIIFFYFILRSKYYFSL